MLQLDAVASSSQSLSTNPVSPERREVAEAVIRDLRKGKLPQMVDWIDPTILGAVAVRTIISSTIGQYADQRPMQAAIDDSSPDELLARHDYSRIKPNRLKMPANFGNRLLTPDSDGRVWVDFIADLGDGFEATYAMAYLMAASRLEVGTSNGQSITLPGSEVLVLGGDLAYPNATVKEYQDRCLTPYEMAFHADDPKRKLFYIAGNHDWYDGLTAFTSVFCTARDRYTHGIGKQIGGWLCHQRRSYVALKLPFGWWMWGVDVGLTDTIDDAQLDYFHTMSEATKPSDKIIIITHAPAWINKRTDGLHEMTMLAEARGAKVCAVLAGDLHHYSRYYSQDTNVHLITSGGGGAFAHATHQLKSRMRIDWAVRTEADRRIAEASDTPQFNREEREAVGDGGSADFTAQRISISAAQNGKPNLTRRLGKSANQWLTEPHDFSSPNFYPSRGTSRLLVLRNLWLPFHNKRFAVMLGLIYMVFGWVFQLSVADPLDAMKKSQYANADLNCLARLKVDAAPADMALCRTDAYKRVDETLGKLASQIPEANLSPKPPQADKPDEELSQQEREDFAHKAHRELRTLWKGILLYVSPKRVVLGMLNNPAFLLMLVALWWGLVSYVDAAWNSRLVNFAARLVLGTLHTLAHLSLLLILTAIFGSLIYLPLTDGKNDLWKIVVGASAETFVVVFFGGLLGGMVWGLYWAITSALFGMHMDAFSALGIKDYKNFLRLSFEPDRLTIYPIGLDKIPGRRGWRAPFVGEHLPDHNPLILPVRPLSPRLIEEPIVIETKLG